MRASIRILSPLGLLWASLVLLTGCTPDSPAATPGLENTTASTVSQKPPGDNPLAGKSTTPTEVPVYSYEIVKAFPHDPGAFTQGLVFLDGALLESTGLNGQSSLRKVDLQTGRVLQRVEVPVEYFAEGMAVLGGRVFQLTWQNHKGFVYDLASFRPEKEFVYEGEGWGLTTDGHWLILSDGTDQIRFLDPVTFEVKRTIRVYVVDHPVGRLNELEYVKGEIFANIWGANYIVRIDPATGRVTGMVDFTGLLAPQDRRADTDVLNGIAYDAAENRLFVTGKRWPKLFEVRLKLK
jgi:glutamine cyclotransferase